MVVESIVLTWWSKSFKGVWLGWDLVTVKAVAFYSHFQIHQTFSEPCCMEAFDMFSTLLFTLTLISSLSVVLPKHIL